MRYSLPVMGVHFCLVFGETLGQVHQSSGCNFSGLLLIIRVFVKIS